MTHLCAHLYICISIYMQTKRQKSTVNVIKNGCCRQKDGCLANSLGWWWRGVVAYPESLVREMSLSLSVELYT